MSARVLVVQHHPAEGPGAIVDWARARGVALDVVLASAGALPDPGMHDAVVLLGGPWAAFGDQPGWLRAEARWIEACVARDLPLFAICLGSQLLARALGARVQRMPVPETGWQAVTLEDGGVLEVLQWHEDGFDLPPGTRRIAGNAHWPEQGYRDASGRRVGLQFHAEWTPASIAALYAAFGTDCPLPSPVADDSRHAAQQAWLHGALDRWTADAGLA